MKKNNLNENCKAIKTYLTLSVMKSVCKVFIHSKKLACLSEWPAIAPRRAVAELAFEFLEFNLVLKEKCE